MTWLAENFQMARGAVEDYFVRVSEDTLLKSPLPGLQPLRKKLLESALKYYKEFIQQRGDDPRLRKELAQAYFRVGLITAETGKPADALVYLGMARRPVPATFDRQPRRRDVAQ